METPEGFTPDEGEPVEAPESASTDPAGDEATPEADVTDEQVSDESDQEAAAEPEPVLSETDETIMGLEATVASLEDDLKRARADLFNLDKEYSNYVRRAKSQAGLHRADGERAVVEALISVLDDIAAARDADQLDGPFAAIATKLETSLETNFAVTRFGQAGEDFDPEKHDALMAETSADVEGPTVAQVLQPGYLKGDHVLRAAKVMVHNPE